MSVTLVEPIPRVNGALLASHVGKKVTLVGSVEAAAAGSLTVVASDKQQVRVNTSAIPEMPQQKFVEIVGTVNPDRTVTAESLADVGDSVDMEAYDQLCQLMPAFPTIF